MKRSRSLSLVLVIVTYFLVIFVKMSPSIVMPSYQSNLGLSSSMVGLISGAYFFSYAFMQLAAGPFCKRVGAVNVIGIGIVIAAIGLIVFGFGGNVFSLFLGRLLLGLGTGPIFVALLFFLQCNYDASGYVRNYSIAVFVSNLGSAFSAAPLKYALQFVSIKVLFSILATLSALVAFLLFVFGTNGDYASNDSGKSFMEQLSSCSKAVVSDSHLVGSLLIWMLVSGGILAYQGLWCTKWTSSAFPEFADFSGLSGTLVSFGIMTASMVSSRFSRLCGREDRTVLVSGWLQILALSLVTMVKSFDTKAFLIISLVSDFIFGMIMGNVCLQIPPFVADIADKEKNATIMGILNFIANLFAQTVQYGTGKAIDRTGSFAKSFLIMTALYALIMVFVSLLVVCGKRKPRVQPKQLND